MNVKRTVLIGLFGGLSFILYLFKVPVPFFPPMLSYDLSDIPAFVLAMLVSPGSGVMVLLLKNILDYLFFGSYVIVPIGQMANFLSATTLIVSLSWFYHRVYRFRFKDILVSILIFLIVICSLNYFFILPAIIFLLGINVEQYVSGMQEFIPFFSNQGLFFFILTVIFPYNLIKAVLIISVGLYLTKRLNRMGFIEKYHF